MVALWTSTALLIIALVIAVVRYLRSERDDNVLPPQEPTVKIPETYNGLDADFVIFDEFADIDPKLFLKPKQMKSRPRNKK